MKFLFRHAVTSLTLVSFMTTFSVCQAQEYLPREAFSNDEWGYIRQEFVTKVDDRNHIYIQNALKYFVITAGVGVGLKLLLSSWSIIMGWIQERIKHEVAFSILKEFLNQWPDNKPYTPKELHKTFEQLKKKYEARSDRGDVRLKEVSYTSILKECFNQWQENKSYTLKELHKIFEQLKKKYEARGDGGDAWLREVSYTVVKEISRKHILA